MYISKCKNQNYGSSQQIRTIMKMTGGMTGRAPDSAQLDLRVINLS